MISGIRKRKELIEYEFSDEFVPGSEIMNSETDVLSILLVEESYRNLAKAISLLPDNYRKVFELRFYWEFSEKQIAKMTGMNYSTVRVHIHRALKKLAELYRRIDEGDEENDPEKAR